MDRINGADFVDIGGGRRGFKGEDLVLGIPGTEVTEVFLNNVQEELLTVIEAAGLVPNPANMGQLLEALVYREAGHVQPHVPVISVSTTAPPGGPTRADTYLVPPAATGAWAGHAQQLAEWTGTAWRFITTKDGHVVGRPDGRQYVKVGGVYVLRRRGSTPADNLFYGCF